jgi:hypothetical protein
MMPFVRRPIPFLAALPLAAGLVMAGSPRVAAAQFGGLLKKATEKVVDKATGAEDKVAPNVNGAELTDDAINRLIKGLGVTAEKMGQREALQAQLEQRDKALRDLREPNEAAIRSWENAHSTWRSCFDNQMNKLSKSHEGQAKVAMMKVMGDPAKAQKYGLMMQEFSTEQQAAMAAGDTIRLAKAQARYQTAVYAMMGIDLSADSSTARGTCGGEPKPLAVMAKIDGLEKQRDSVQVRVRDIESTAQIEGARAAAMPLPEFALQKEKATVFLGSGNGGGMLTRDELNRLRAKRAELERVKKAL